MQGRWLGRRGEGVDWEALSCGKELHSAELCGQALTAGRRPLAPARAPSPAAAGLPAAQAAGGRLDLTGGPRAFRGVGDL